LYPKSQIDVHVIVLEDSGSVLAAALTCAGLALADASIHMFDVIVGASSVKLIDNERRQ
jgi:exosome complex component MTR3